MSAINNLSAMQVRLMGGMLVPDSVDPSYLDFLVNGLPKDDEGTYYNLALVNGINSEFVTIKTKSNKDVALLLLASTVLTDIQSEIFEDNDNFEPNIANIRKTVFGDVLSQIKEPVKPDDGRSVVPRKLSSIILFVHYSMFEGSDDDNVTAKKNIINQKLSDINFNEFFSPDNLLAFYRQFIKKKKKDAPPPSSVPTSDLDKVFAETDNLIAFTKLVLKLTMLVSKPDKGSTIDVAYWILGSTHGGHTSGSPGWVSFVYGETYHWVTGLSDGAAEVTGTGVGVSTSKMSKSRKASAEHLGISKKNKSQKNTAVLDTYYDVEGMWTEQDEASQAIKSPMKEEKRERVTSFSPAVLAQPMTSEYDENLLDSVLNLSQAIQPVEAVLPQTEDESMAIGFSRLDLNQHSASHVGADTADFALFRLSDLEKDPVLRQLDEK